MDANRSLTTRIIERVAAEEEVDASDIDHQLYEVIDGDALTGAIESMESTGVVAFDYLGYRVAVTGDERIKVSEQNNTEARQIL
jgi:hypothetical protein